MVGRQAGEATQIFFSLFSAKENRFITEDFADYVTEQGLPEKRELIGNVKTLFKASHAARSPRARAGD